MGSTSVIPALVKYKGPALVFKFFNFGIKDNDKKSKNTFDFGTILGNSSELQFKSGADLAFILPMPNGYGYSVGGQWDFNETTRLSSTAGFINAVKGDAESWLMKQIPMAKSIYNIFQSGAYKSQLNYKHAFYKSANPLTLSLTFNLFPPTLKDSNNIEFIEKCFKYAVVPSVEDKTGQQSKGAAFMINPPLVELTPIFITDEGEPTIISQMEDNFSQFYYNNLIMSSVNTQYYGDGETVLTYRKGSGTSINNSMVGTIMSINLVSVQGAMQEGDTSTTQGTQMSKTSKADGNQGAADIVSEESKDSGRATISSSSKSALDIYKKQLNNQSSTEKSVAGNTSSASQSSVKPSPGRLS